MIIETITADLLQMGDIIDSHDDWPHLVAALDFDDDSGTVWVEVAVGYGLDYACRFNYDDEVKVVG